MILKILEFFSSSFNTKIHHLWLQIAPPIARGRQYYSYAHTNDSNGDLQDDFLQPLAAQQWTWITAQLQLVELGEPWQRSNWYYHLIPEVHEFPDSLDSTVFSSMSQPTPGISKFQVKGPNHFVCAVPMKSTIRISEVRFILGCLKSSVISFWGDHYITNPNMARGNPSRLTFASSLISPKKSPI